MPIPRWLEQTFFAAADTASAVIPRSAPPVERIQDCMIIAHRGRHGGGGPLENTLSAFDAAVEGGADGIEFDVRWTEDLVPVVCHDADTRRVFRLSKSIAETPFSTLRQSARELPSLEDVLARYGGKVHLMIELKDEPYPRVAQQMATLQSLLGNLAGAQDFHVLAHDAGLLESLRFLPPRARLALARSDVRRKSELALAHGYGGLLGQHALVPTKVVERHLAAGQRVGTGFVASRNCFFREVGRGVQWIFTNHSAELVGLRNRINAAAKYGQ
jgi:glycerophosphoryl diester phosphodiesterase